MKKTKKKKNKTGIFHHAKRVHRHVKKHLKKLKNKRPRVHKALVLMSITLPLVLGALLFGSSALYYYESYLDVDYGGKEKINVNLPVVVDDTIMWKTYEDKKTGFSIKYPDNWPDPKPEESQKGSNYLQKITFSNGLEANNKRYKKYEIYAYDSKKFPGPVGTDNLISKGAEKYETNDCDKLEFQEAVLGEGDYPGQEVNIYPNDKCFLETYFFSVARGDYTYNIIPTVAETDNPFEVGKKPDVIAAFPKFFEILSTLVIPEQKQGTQQEKQVIQKKIIERKVQPHRVLIRKASCAIKNHHGKKSKTKGHHMDEDCCIDPDESPNPRCQY